MSALSQKQQEVVDIIRSLILEHFDGGVYSLILTDVGDELDEVTLHGCLGGRAQGLGLLAAHAQELLND